MVTGPASLTRPGRNIMGPNAIGLATERGGIAGRWTRSRISVSRFMNRLVMRKVRSRSLGMNRATASGLGCTSPGGTMPRERHLHRSG
ncbi:hypothetical protein ABIA39_000156 [Nocardia sp. GAS34]